MENIKIDISILNENFIKVLEETNKTIKEKKIRVLESEVKEVKDYYPLFKNSLWDGVSFAISKEGDFCLYDFGAKKILTLKESFNIIPFANVVDIMLNQFSIIKTVKKMNSVQFREFIDKYLLE